VSFNPQSEAIIEDSIPSDPSNPSNLEALEKSVQIQPLMSSPQTIPEEPQPVGEYPKPISGLPRTYSTFVTEFSPESPVSGLIMIVSDVFDAF